MKYLIVILMIFSCTACGTIGARGKEGNYGKIYPATNLDVKCIEEANSERNWLFPPFLVTSLCVVDMPVSVITDSIFLPVDLVCMPSK